MKHTQSESDKSPLVLVVDDSKSVQKELCRSIESELGFRTAVVTTYQEARDYLNQHSRDIFLALLDLHLPDAQDGEVVDLFASVAVPSIVFTSDFTQATRERIQSKEIIDYVVKDCHAVKNVLGYIRRLYHNRSNRVIVVEDSGTFRLFVSSLLHRQMFQVEDFPDAETALAYMENEDDVSMLIIDYALPGMDGLELTKRLRERHGMDELVILGLSSVSDPSLAPKFIKMGANDFITKPFELEAFYSRINHHVEVLELFRALRRANDIKNQFLGMAAHDLRSPISGIQGMIGLLRSGSNDELTEEQQEILSYIDEANSQMKALVNDLLDISAIDAGMLRLKEKRGSLKRVIEERLRILDFTARKKGIDFSPSLSDVPEFAFDGNRIAQVMDNLLSNAIKFAPKDTYIEVTLGERDGEALVCVKDHGQGVPPGETEMLFRSFKRTSVQPTAGETSTGLGLPIVRKIVKGHGGRVWVESEFGKGAMFCFTLPMK